MISSTTRTAGPYAGNGSQTVFPFNFVIFAAADLLVQQTDNLGNVTTLTLTSQYSVTLNSNQNTTPGGTVNLTTATPTGYTLNMSSQEQAIQPVNLTNSGNFYPQVINNALDYITILIQQILTRLTGVLSFPLGDPASAQLPAVASRANNLLGFDANGNAVAYTPAAGTATALSTALSSSAGTTMINGTWFGSVVTTISALASSIGSSLLGFIQAGTGAIARSIQSKLRDNVSAQDFGALGNGVANDTTAFVNATALGLPVYVPYTSSFYVVTALTAAQQELLWGPGVVQVAGVQIQLQSAPVVQNNGGTIPNTGGAVISAVRNALAPANQLGGIPGNVGSGMISTIATRSGGYGLYGNWLSTLTVSAATPSPQFDNGITSWATHQNLTGGTIYGMWPGANTPSKALGQTFSGGAAVGMEVNVGNRWTDFGAQTDIGGTRYTVGLQVVPDVLPTTDGLNTYAVSGITVATPAVITTSAPHNLTAGSTVTLGGTGTVPTGLNIGYYYYVLATGLTATSFQVSSF